MRRQWNGSSLKPQSHLGHVLLIVAPTRHSILSCKAAIWMKSTGENLPVYEGSLRISREIIVKPALKATDPSLFKLFSDVCLDPSSHIKASGALMFQACDEQRCYPPQTIQPQWRFQFVPPDRQRSPGDLLREV